MGVSGVVADTVVLNALVVGANTVDENAKYHRNALAEESDVEATDPNVELGEVYRQNVRFAWRLVVNLGVRPDDVADVVQEVFIIVHRRLGEVVLSTSVRAWIYGICARCCANYRRRALTRREQLYSDPPDRSAEDCRTADDNERVSARLDLERVLGTLDEHQRAVFLLYEVEELSMPEVAEALGIPLSTAYSRLHAARTAFRRELLKGHTQHHEQGYIPWTTNRRG